MTNLTINELLGHELSSAFYLDKINRYAATDCIILLTGETGVGKSFFAKKIMEKSKRSNKPYDEINCGRYTGGTLESELFGHKKGSFTGAYHDKKGLFEQLNHGTLFMDEITETTNEFQTMLLKLIDNMTIRKIGDDKNINVDVRLIFATNKDLLIEIDKGNFRHDLYFRIEQFKVGIPPLRERKTQIPEFTNYFVNKYNKIYKRFIKSVSPEVSEIFLKYPWPGNVREFEKSIEHAFVMMETEDDVITKSHLSESILNQANKVITDMTSSKPLLVEPTMTETLFETSENKNDHLSRDKDVYSRSYSWEKFFELDFRDAKNYAEKSYLENLLKITKGNITEVSRLANISRNQIYNLLKKHNLEVNDAKPDS